MTSEETVGLDGVAAEMTMPEAAATGPAPVKPKRVMSEAQKEKLRAAALARGKKAKRKAAKVAATGAAPTTGALQGGLSLDQKVAILLIDHGQRAVVASMDKLIQRLAAELAK